MPTERIPDHLLKLASPEELGLYRRSLERDVALASPADFAEHVAPGRFQRPLHIELLNDTITALIEGTLRHADGRQARRLLVTLPPRHGKSEFCSKYTPAWYTSKYPDRRIILTSYEADFAAHWGGQVRAIIESDEAQGIAPALRQNSRAAHRWYTTEGGGMQTAGAGGPITGKGANLFIIDDPVKGADEANSEVMRQKTYDWYQGVAYTRLEPDAVIILIQTRWHEGDLAGMCLQNEPENWYHIDIPAIAGEDDPLGRPPGAALWPERYDETALAEIRATVGPYFWAALYQQQPFIEGGGVIPVDKFRFYNLSKAEKGLFARLQLPEGQTKLVWLDKCVKFTTIDLAATTKNTADWTVFCLWGLTPDKELLLLDRIRVRVESADHMRLLEERDTAWRPAFHGIERATYGLTLIQQAQRQAHLRIRELRPDKDKVSRAFAAGALTDAGRVYLPASAPWLSEFTHECASFPNGSHDDQVDCFSYAADVATQRLTRPHKNSEPEVTDYGQRIWKQLKKNRRRTTHPVLGRMP